MAGLLFATYSRPNLLTVLLVGLLFLLRYQMVKPPDLKEGTRIRVRGVLREEPAIFGQTQGFSLQGIKIKARRFPEYHYGDELIITGRLKVRVINRFYKEYRLNYPEIEALIINYQSSTIFSWIFRLKKKIEEVYNSVLPEPQASLLAGIVLGSKRRTSARFLQALKKTGTMHVVVASGANIALVSKPLVENLSGFLSRKIALPVALVFIWIYTIMAGFEPPVVRAAIMATTAFFAQFIGREKDAILGLIFSGALMLFVSPMLVFDLGFQLSFAATLGILLFYPKIKPFFKKLSFFGDDLSTTLAAQIFVLPIIYFSFKELSLISPFVNSLVLWTISPIMQMGAILAFSGFISRKISQLLAYPTWLFLTFFVKVIEFFGT